MKGVLVWCQIFDYQSHNSNKSSQIPHKVVSACAALGSAASYAMGSIAYVAVELAPKITAALMKSVMLREVATQTPNLVSA